MKREIITIDGERCTGCGLCIPGCPEGALQLIDGKARLISDLMCDGLGACIGECPEGAITIEEREAEPYDERKVMENIVKQGPNVIAAHLKHLKDHGQDDFLREALAVLKEKGIVNPLENTMTEAHPQVPAGGCPGSRAMQFGKDREEGAAGDGSARPSQLTHWPIQLHLMSPNAPHYRGSDMLLAADCTAFTLGDFHKDYLKGKKLAIACPKLDERQDIYTQKITSLIDEAKINTLTVMIMQVPCCRGLLAMAQQAAGQAKRKIPVKSVVVGLEGDILQEDWVTV